MFHQIDCPLVRLRALSKKSLWSVQCAFHDSKILHPYSQNFNNTSELGRGSPLVRLRAYSWPACGGVRQALTLHTLAGSTSTFLGTVKSFHYYCLPLPHIPTFFSHSLSRGENVPYSPFCNTVCEFEDSTASRVFI